MIGADTPLRRPGSRPSLPPMATKGAGPPQLTGAFSIRCGQRIVMVSHLWGYGANWRAWIIDCPPPQVAGFFFSWARNRNARAELWAYVCLPRVVPPTVRRFPKADHDPDDARAPVSGVISYGKPDAVDPYRTSLERAFELARSGRCATIDEIKQRLKAELFDQHIIEGRALRSQLRKLIAASRSRP